MKHLPVPVLAPVFPSTFSSSLRLSSSPSSCSSSTSLQPKFSQLEAPASPAPFPAPPLAPPLLLPPPFLIAQLVARNSCSSHPPRLAGIFTASPTVLPPHKSLLRLHPCADIFRCPYQQLPLVLLPPLIPAPSRPRSGDCSLACHISISIIRILDRDDRVSVIGRRRKPQNWQKRGLTGDRQNLNPLGDVRPAVWRALQPRCIMMSHSYLYASGSV
jgi:hypothetical protein